MSTGGRRGVLSTSRLVSWTRASFRLVLQIGFLFLVFRAAEWGVAYFHVPLPGNIVGMLLLFSLLSAGLVRERWIQEGATFLTKHLAFFFIPIAVGLMEWGPLFRREGHWLLLVIVVSTLAALLAAGGLVHLISARVPAEGGERWKAPRLSRSPSSSPSASMR